MDEVTSAERDAALARGREAAFLRQPEQTLRQIRAAFDRRVVEHQRGDHLELPVSVKLAHGHKAV